MHRVLVFAALAIGFSLAVPSLLAERNAKEDSVDLADVERTPAAGRTVRLDADQSGHFVAKFRINGHRVDGLIDTGATAVGASSAIADGPAFFGFGGFGGDSLTSFTDIDVTNTTDIDITNNVTAIQNTVIDLDVGPGSSAIISDALNAAPSQNIAVGNFGGAVDTGVGTEVFSEDFIG